MTKEKIIRAMELAALAYKKEQPIAPGTVLTKVDDRATDVQYYIRKSGSKLSITFRGSDSKQDWQTDLTFWKKAIPYGNDSSDIRVHTGFINAYKSPGVRARIHEFMTDDVRFVIIAGHSYGAALAVLCAVDLDYNFPDREYEAFLFGCPRVGNRAFQKSYNKRVVSTVRVENGNDIVTKVPFKITGYRHVGAKIHVGFPRIFGLFSANAHYQHAYLSSLLTPEFR